MPAIRWHICLIWFCPGMHNKMQNLPYMTLSFKNPISYNEGINVDNRRKIGCVTDILITKKENM